MSEQYNPPGLYIVATPIGNLDDITLRALTILKLADIIVCEDTRVTAKLLSHYGISKTTISYNDHNGEQRRPMILQALRDGKHVALVSDAGTPLISDPGYKLVRDVIAENHYVTALPGPSSVLAALCLSGLPSDRFLFAGFLPSKQEACRKEVQTLMQVPATLIWFESATRLAASLAVLSELLGARPAAVVREISKRFEETRRGTLFELLEYYQAQGAPRGEVVVVVAPPQESEADDDAIRAQLLLLLKSHSVKEASSMLADATGMPRKKLYALALELLQANEK